MKNATMIVTENGNETINSKVLFRVFRKAIDKTNSSIRFDSFRFKTHEEAKNRIETLKNIFKASYEWRIEIINN